MVTFHWPDPYAQLKQEYESWKSRYDSDRGQVDDLHDRYVSDLNTYRATIAYTQALLISGTVYHMTDDQFDGFIAKLSQIPEPSLTPQNSLPADVVQHLQEVTGGSYILKGIYEFGEIAKDASFGSPFNVFLDEMFGIKDVLTGFALGGLDAMPGGDPLPQPLGTILSLPLQAVAFVASVALNIILAPLELFHERQEYETAIAEAQQAVWKVEQVISNLRGARQQLNDATADAKSRFVTVMSKLNAIKPATFDWHDPTMDTMAAAAAEYCILGRLRFDWANVHRNHPQETWSAFVDMEVSMRDAHELTAEQVQEFAGIVRSQSASMSGAAP